MNEGNERTQMTGQILHSQLLKQYRLTVLQNNEDFSMEELQNQPEYQSVLQGFSISQDILMYTEKPCPTIRQYEYFTLEVIQRLAHCSNPCLIVDLRNVKIPDAKSRSKLRSELEYLSEVLTHYAVVVGADMQLKIAAKFIYQSLDVSFSFSTHSTPEEAVAYCKRL